MVGKEGPKWYLDRFRKYNVDAVSSNSPSSAAPKVTSPSTPQNVHASTSSKAASSVQPLSPVDLFLKGQDNIQNDIMARNSALPEVNTQSQTQQSIDDDDDDDDDDGDASSPRKRRRDD